MKTKRTRAKGIPDGVHFLTHRYQLRSLMSPASLEMDGRGGKRERPPVRFGPKP